MYRFKTKDGTVYEFKTASQLASFVYKNLPESREYLTVQSEAVIKETDNFTPLPSRFEYDRCIN